MAEVAAYGVPRRLAVVLGASMACALTSMVIAFVALLRLTETTFDPLGEYPIQRVNSTVAGVAGPAVRLGDLLSVTGTKCAKRDTTVSGRFSWVGIEPPGAAVEAGSGSGVPRLKGCTVATFENRIPDAVRDRVLALAAQGRTSSVWQLTGQECPTAPPDELPVCRTWQSQNFTIVVTGGVGP